MIGRDADCIIEKILDFHLRYGNVRTVDDLDSRPAVVVFSIQCEPFQELVAGSHLVADEPQSPFVPQPSVNADDGLVHSRALQGYARLQISTFFIIRAGRQYDCVAARRNCVGCLADGAPRPGLRTVVAVIARSADVKSIGLSRKCENARTGDAKNGMDILFDLSCKSTHSWIVLRFRAA